MSTTKIQENAKVPQQLSQFASLHCRGGDYSGFSDAFHQASATAQSKAYVVQLCEKGMSEITKKKLLKEYLLSPRFL